MGFVGSRALSGGTGSKHTWVSLGEVTGDAVHGVVIGYVSAKSLKRWRHMTKYDFIPYVVDLKKDTPRADISNNAHPGIPAITAYNASTGQVTVENIGRIYSTTGEEWNGVYNYTVRVMAAV